tara:strand:- start:8898 stop:9584 length:687 start_codon:yes stop_codon:yes gene_type:complete
MKCVLLRVSTDKQEEDNQLHPIKKKYPGEDLKIFRECAVSGGLSWDQRPILHEAIRYSKKNKVPLVVYSLSRLGRTSEVATFFEQEVAKGKIEIDVIDMPNLDQKMIGGLAWVNTLERIMISERTKMAMDRIKHIIATEGSYTTSEGIEITHLGRKDTKDASVIGVAKIKENADNFADNTYPLIKSLQDRGMSLKAIALELNNRGIQTRRKAEWYASSVRNVLQRRAI